MCQEQKCHQDTHPLLKFLAVSKKKLGYRSTLPNNFILCKLNQEHSKLLQQVLGQSWNWSHKFEP